VDFRAFQDFHRRFTDEALLALGAAGEPAPAI
jgi:hypothetical protein